MGFTRYFMAPLSAGLLFRLSVPQDLVNITSTIQSDALFTRDIKAKADQAVQDTIVATRIVDGFRNPQQHGAYLKNHASFPLECVVTPVLIPVRHLNPHSAQLFPGFSIELLNKCVSACSGI